MNFGEFKDRIEQIYKDKFNKSYCKCKIYSCLGKSITIDCHLAENKSEFPHGIDKNDMMQVCFAISLPDGWSIDDDLPENLMMEAWSSSITVKPTLDYLYCEHKKVSYRKTSGDPEKMIATFGKYVDRLYNTIKAEYKANNLLEFPSALIKEKGYFNS